MSDEFDDIEVDEPLRWYSVLAPEGVSSGDGRRFSENALTWRDLPLPLLYQSLNDEGHRGSSVIGRIDRIERHGNLIHAWGVFVDGTYTDEAIGLIGEGAIRGVSIDADMAEMSADQDEDTVEFSGGRVCGATVCAIPAFAEAFISLGDGPEEFRQYDEAERDRMADEGEALDDGSYPIHDVEDLRNAIRAIGRAKDPEKAKAHIKSRAKDLGAQDLIPEDWSAGIEVFAGEVEEFKRGPGWVTDPEETRRLHAYWTKPGHEGYEKIRWGTPGDFTRLRNALSKYIEPKWLNRTAARWHRDALGFWPSECGKPGNPECGSRRGGTVKASPALLLASAERTDLRPAEWFMDPELSGPTPITLDGDRFVAHLATWGTCHIGIKGVCVTAPHSEHNYAYYQLGVKQTDAGYLPVGHITMGTGHADTSHGSASVAAAHYDNTGTVVADVCAGEDEYGIWLAGALRRSATVEQREMLQAAALSGDWRGVGGSLELVASLVVNVPGFPIPRVSLASSGQLQTSLVAAGIVRRGLPEREQLIRDVSLDVRRTNKRVTEMNAAMCRERVHRLEMFAKGSV